MKPDPIDVVIGALYTDKTPIDPVKELAAVLKVVVPLLRSPPQ